MSKTSIEWAQRTWNPVVGCSVKSPGCINCYAMPLAHRLGTIAATAHYAGLTETSKAGPVFTGKVAQAPEKTLLEPLRRKVPTIYFVNSMGDLFHENVPDEWIDKVFAVMALCPQHAFQVLTKRAERMHAYCTAIDVVARVKAAIKKHGNSLPGEEDFVFFDMIGWQSWLEPCFPDCAPPCDKVWASDDPNEKRTIRVKDCDGAQMKLAGQCYGTIRWDGLVQWPLPNVWLGVSAERQMEADKRIPYLLQTPAAIRFVSCEPLLGPIDLTSIVGAYRGGAPDRSSVRERMNVLCGTDRREHLRADGTWNHRRLDDPDGDPCWSGNCHPRLDWVIVGGESGHHARPLDIKDAISLKNQCEMSGTPFFYKQHGEWWHERQKLPVPIPPEILARCRKVKWSDGSVSYRVGKKKAGRYLDGKLHDARPEVRR